MTKFPPIVVQNADTVNASPLMLSELTPEHHLLVFSHFFTVQGEGPWMGRSAYFIRLGGCNYGRKKTHCTWCDTKFSLVDSKVMAFDELLNFVTGAGALRIVVTGGEPCLQKNLVSFIRLASQVGIKVQVETNGSQLTVMKQCKEAGALIVCSPKASQKGFSDKTALTPDHLHCLKFVVSANPDDPHHDIPQWAKDMGVPVYVSPMTVYKRPYVGEVSSAWDADLVDQEATRANYRHAGNLALENNYIVSVQMHTFLEMA